MTIKLKALAATICLEQNIYGKGLGKYGLYWFLLMNCQISFDKFEHQHTR